jgi:hypothetical protein
MMAARRWAGSDGWDSGAEEASPIACTFFAVGRCDVCETQSSGRTQGTYGIRKATLWAAKRDQG